MLNVFFVGTHSFEDISERTKKKPPILRLSKGFVALELELLQAWCRLNNWITMFNCSEIVQRNISSEHSQLSVHRERKDERWTKKNVPQNPYTDSASEDKCSGRIFIGTRWGAIRKRRTCNNSPVGRKCGKGWKMVWGFLCRFKKRTSTGKRKDVWSNDLLPGSDKCSTASWMKYVEHCRNTTQKKHILLNWSTLNTANVPNLSCRWHNVLKQFLLRFNWNWRWNIQFQVDRLQVFLPNLYSPYL